MRRFLPLFVLFCTIPVFATDIYFAPTSAGSNNGTSCGNAYAYSDGVHGWSLSAQQVAGNNLHICSGTYTGSAGGTLMTFVNSGTAGNPITFIADQGAVTFTAPYWSGTNGAIHGSGLSYITICGSTSANCGVNGTSSLTVTASANGTNLANQQQTYGTQFTDCTNCIEENVTMTNLYVNAGSSSGATDTNGQFTACSRFDHNNTSTLVTRNTLSQCKTGIQYDADSGGTGTGFTASWNTITDVDWGINIGGDTTGTNLTGIVLSNNDIGGSPGWTNWTYPTSAYHQDGIILFAFDSPGEATLSATINGNYIHGDLTAGSPTGFIYCAQNTTCNLINNVLVNTGHVIFGIAWLDTHKCSYQVYNNTIVALAGVNDFAYTFGTSTCDTGVVAGNKLGNNIATNFTGGSAVGIHDYSTLTTDVATSNFNVWNGSSGSSGIQMATNDSTFISYATWLTDGFDANSSKANPTLNASAPPYTLQSGSPAIGLGTNLTSLCTGALTSLCTGAPQTFGATGSCGSGCLARSASAAWDTGAYPFTSSASPTSLEISGDVRIQGNVTTK